MDLRGEMQRMKRVDSQVLLTTCAWLEQRKGSSEFHAVTRFFPPVVLLPRGDRENCLLSRPVA